jgi:hypothetical protein
LKDQIGNSIGGLPTMRMNIERLLELYDEESLTTPRSRYYEIAAYISNQLGDAEAAKGYAGRAMKYYGWIAGPGSEEVKRMAALEKDPKGHPSWVPSENESVGEDFTEEL